jgi:hypothetical protein
MLRVNVGLSRKVSKDYNSTGFSINLDGEVSAPVSDPETVIEQVKELFDVAEEALDREIHRHQSDTAIASRDNDPPPPNTNGRAGRTGTNGSPPPEQPAPANTNGYGIGRSRREEAQAPEAATNKQINYLLNLGKRGRLSTVQLEQKIEEVLGQQVGLYDLGKRDAAKVIDALTNGSATTRR